MTDKQREYQRQYREKNKEILNAKRKNYRMLWIAYFLKIEKEIRNCKRRKEYIKKYYEEHKEHRKEYLKEYYQKNKEEIKFKNKKYACKRKAEG